MTCTYCAEKMRNTRIFNNLITFCVFENIICAFEHLVQISRIKIKINIYNDFLLSQLEKNMNKSKTPFYMV